MYKLEFILHIYSVSAKTLKSSLAEFGDDLEITDFCQEAGAKGRDFKININTEEPTVIFDICSQFGRIKSIKVNEA
jgi:dihydroxyacetone kinase-like predicted kinase